VTLTIKKVEKWQTSDGKTFDHKCDADQWVLRQGLAQLLMNCADLTERDANEVIDTMDLHLEEVKAWVEAMEIARKETKANAF
jgi:hypothetical protein